MRSTITIVLLFFIILPGCSFIHKTKPQEKSPQTEVTFPESTQNVTPEMIEEYAMIHQIRDLKKAEFYLRYPDYAKKHPYVPTHEDTKYYEEKFFKAMDDWSNKYFSLNKLMIGIRDGKPISENDIVSESYEKGMNFYDSGNINKAIESLEKAVYNKPDAPAMLYNLGIMYMKKEDYAKAIPCFQNSIKYIKGTGYTKVNFLTYNGVYLGANVNLGLIYTKMGMYNDAIITLREAAKFKPNDLDANWNLALAYYSMAEIEKATEQMRQYINIDLKNAEAHNAIGLLYYRRQLYNAALEEFHIAGELKPDDRQYSYNEGLLLARFGRYDEAGRAFKRASGLKDGEDVRQVFLKQTEANKVRELYNSGCSEMDKHNHDSAIEYFNSALKLKPDMAEAHLNLGFCYRQKGDVPNQIAHFQKASKLKPDTPSIHYNLGLAYFDAFIYSEASVEFRKAIELDPSYRDAHFSLGTVLFKTSNIPDAIKEFEKCAELSPEWFEAHLNLGTCYIKTHNIDGAIIQFEKTLQLRPNSAEAHYDLGIAYMKANKLDEASELFRKALKINPAHSLARSMLYELESRQTSKE